MQMSCQEEYENILTSVLRKFKSVKDAFSNQLVVMAVIFLDAI